MRKEWSIIRGYGCGGGIYMLIPEKEKRTP
jgi:hypothetical protein